MKLINGIVNTLTYIGANAFIMSVMLVGTLGVKMVIELLPTYLTEMKTPNLFEWILWGGLLFVIFSIQQFTYGFWKNYLKLK